MGLDAPTVLIVAIAHSQCALIRLKMMVPLAHQGAVLSRSGSEIKHLVGVREIALPQITPHLQLRDVINTHDLCHTSDEIQGLLGLVVDDVVGGIDLIAVGRYPSVPCGVLVLCGLGKRVEEPSGQVIQLFGKTPPIGLSPQSVVVRCTQLNCVALIVHVSQCFGVVSGRGPRDGVCRVSARHGPLTGQGLHHQ